MIRTFRAYDDTTGEFLGLVVTSERHLPLWGNLRLVPSDEAVGTPIEPTPPATHDDKDTHA